MNERKREFRAGLADGIPIGLGYLAVSFTFGIMAGDAGLTAPQAVVLSLTNLTSAGQFAGLGVAMENGVLPVRKAADYITASNNADGVGLVVEKFML